MVQSNRTKIEKETEKIESVKNTFSKGWRFDFMAKARSITWIEDYFFDRAIKDTDSILILGVGGGRTAFPLRDRCKEIVGIDFSKNLINLANNRNKYQNINLF